MELWGFENRFESVGMTAGLFTIPGRNGPNRTSSSSSATRGADEIPQLHDALTVLPEDGNNLEEVGSRQEFVIRFEREPAQRGSRTPNPSDSWSYRGVFVERDGVAGISSKEEAEMVRDQVERFSHFEELQRRYPRDPIVEYHDHDGSDTDTNQDHAGMPFFGGVDYLAEGESLEDDELLDPAGAAIQNPSRANFRKLELERAEVDALIAVLLAALCSGNLDVIASLFNAIAQRSGLTVAQVAARTAEALGMADREAAEFGDKFADLYKKSDDPKKRAEMLGELKKLEVLYQQNTNRREQLQSILRQSFSVNETMNNANEGVMRWNDRRGQRGWGM